MVHGPGSRRSELLSERRQLAPSTPAQTATVGLLTLSFNLLALSSTPACSPACTTSRPVLFGSLPGPFHIFCVELLHGEDRDLGREPDASALLLELGVEVPPFSLRRDCLDDFGISAAVLDSGCEPCVLVRLIVRDVVFGDTASEGVVASSNDEELFRVSDSAKHFFEGGHFIGLGFLGCIVVVGGRC